MNKLIFVYENCDSFVVDWDKVRDFQISGVESNIVRNTDGDLVNISTFKNSTAEIDQGANIEHDEFGYFPSGLSEFTCLARSEITQIIVEDDFTEHTYFLQEGQHVTVQTVGGNLFVEIS